MTIAKEPTYIAGVGASAGGLKALIEFFSQVPLGSEIAFVVVQHLSPDYESHMVNLLSKQTELPVQQATDGLTVQPNNIYLIPRRKNMTIFKGKLFLTDYQRVQGAKLPIDIFFESLAEEQKDKAVGVILSGTGSDGTRGIQMIKEAGGLTMAQDQTAKFDGMPRSAISTDLVDFVASPEKLCRALLSYAKNEGHFVHTENLLLKDQTQMEKLFAILRTHTGIDFSEYKPKTIARRLERRMSLNQVEEIEDYINYLDVSPLEAKNLVKEFLIGVTKFFRDREAFAIIADEIIPKIFERKQRQEPVRVWTPGCATGEEAYSLAILFQEYMQTHNHFLPIKIFATDVNRTALDFAGQGSYPELSLTDVSATRLNQFFVANNQSYEVTRQLRSMVIFAKQDLIKDPPFAKIDLVVCRNLLIYLQPTLQSRIFSIFQFSLRRGGFLFLGSSESIGDFADVFAPISSKWKIFQYKGSSLPQLTTYSVLSNPQRHPSSSLPKLNPVMSDDENPVWDELIKQLVPPCVVVDENRIVLHTFGEVKPFLEAPIGLSVSLDIQKMVPEALISPLSTALYRTFSKGEMVRYRNIQLHDGQVGQTIHLTTRLFQDRQSTLRLGLIIFELAEESVDNDADKTFNFDKNALQRIANLEQELSYTRENLQTTIEELETANEELQAANEELLAANEQLQSTNEELQSVNEELTTVNIEYQHKIQELVQLNDDINNLLNASPIGTVFLDAALKIRKFTPPVQEVIHLLEQDIGRSLNHISHRLLEVDLVAEASHAFQTQTSITLRLQSETQNWYVLEISPYLTHTNEVDGVILTFTDVSEQVLMQGQQANDQVKINTAIEAGGLAFWEMNLATGEVKFSARKAEVLGYRPQKFNHYSDFTTLIHPDDYEMTMDAMRQHLNAQARTYHVEYRIRADDQSYHWFRDTGQVTRRKADGTPLIVAGITNDVTDSKQLLETFAKSQAEQTRLTSELDGLTDLHQAAGFGQYQVNHTNGIIHCSDQAAEILGLSPSSQGHTVQTVVAQLHADDRQTLEQVLKHGYEAQTRHTLRYAVLHGDDYRQVEQVCHTHFMEGKPHHSTALIRHVP